MDINERVRILRENLNMSRRVFGEKLGVSGDVISNIEYNRLKRPDQKEPLYQLICEKFEVNEEWLRTGNGEMYIQRTRTEKITDFAADILKDEEESFRRRLVEALAELDVEEWELLEKIAEKAVKKRKARQNA